jgi:deazaflavin-dependent oxidoreductase (nitroreductase family)
MYSLNSIKRVHTKGDTIMNIPQQSHQLDREEQRHTYPARNVILLSIGTLLALALAARIRTAIGFRQGDPTTINKKRFFNKSWSNRITTTVGRAGQPNSIFARVHHVGRRSGKVYATPVRVVPVEGGFIIPLTYGSRADWYRNIQAKGEGEIQWQGKTYHVDQPDMIDATQALPAFPLPSRFLFWLDGVPQFVRVSYMQLPGGNRTLVSPDGSPGEGNQSQRFQNSTNDA